MPAPSDHDRLDALLTARHPCIATTTFEEEHVLELLAEVAIARGLELWVWSVTRGLRDGLVARSQASQGSEHPAAAMTLIADGRPGGRKAVYALLDAAGHLKDERTLRTLREAIALAGSRGDHIVLIDHADALPPVIKSLSAPFDVSLPDEAELDTIIRVTLRRLREERHVEVSLSRADLTTIVRNLRGLSRRQARQMVTEAACDDARFDAADVARMLARKRQAVGGDGLLEHVETPVGGDEVGGLRRLKAWLDHRRCASDADAIAFGLSAPRGVLMLGVQGAGKSLAAKAVATAWQRPLLRLDAGALYDRYIGESERRLRDALAQAERMAPVVLWIDEIEKGFASAASLSSDGGLSKRLFGTLLTWMQEHTAPVFLIATANDIEALPPELLRKGRFDEIFFVDLPGLEARHAIVRIHLAKRKRDPARFEVDELAAAAEGFSGAEIEQAIVSALHEAFAARQELSTRHVLEALRGSPPLSVTMAERIATLRAWASGRCVPAD